VRRLPPSCSTRQCLLKTKRECDALQQEYDADQDDTTLPFARAVRFWPSDHAAKPRDPFVHAARELDRYTPLYARRPARMVRYDAPEDEILIYTSASCLNQQTTSAARSAASSCVFKPTGLHPSEPRTMAMRPERRGQTGREYPQEATALICEQPLPPYNVANGTKKAGAASQSPQIPNISSKASQTGSKSGSRMAGLLQETQGTFKMVMRSRTKICGSCCCGKSRSSRTWESRLGFGSFCMSRMLKRMRKQEWRLKC
jgi:hypothetical protein